MKRLIFTATLILAFIASFGQSDLVIVTLSPVSAPDTISRHIYGHFAEHLGRCIYGGFYVGDQQDSIPHTAGVRNDIIKALRELEIPNLRWPGGCFADTYHWKDGIGPREDRPTIVNQWWGGTTENNHFGTHEFLNLCELLEAEPYLSGNVGSGTVQEFIDWMQYTNHSGVSPMADWRRENGREAPWDVKFWGIGNEAWGCGGNMTAEYYADIYRQYATFLSAWSGPTGVYRIASGASEDDYHWTETLMKNVPPSLMEAVALHDYAVYDWTDKGPSAQFDEEIYFKTMREALLMKEYVSKHIKIMDQYDPDNQIALFVDEWGGWYDTEPELANGVLFQQNTIRDAMIAGSLLNIFNNHARRIKMANLAQTVNVLQAVILTEGEQMILTPTYHVMKMYKVHQDAQLIPTSVSVNPQYRELDALSVSASRDHEGLTHISLVNIHPTEPLQIRIETGLSSLTKLSAQILTSDHLQDYNSFQTPDVVMPQEFPNVQENSGSVDLMIPAHAVIVIEIQ